MATTARRPALQSRPMAGQTRGRRFITTQSYEIVLNREEAKQKVPSCLRDRVADGSYTWKLFTARGPPCVASGSQGDIWVNISLSYQQIYVRGGERSGASGWYPWCQNSTRGAVQSTKARLPTMVFHPWLRTRSLQLVCTELVWDYDAQYPVHRRHWDTTIRPALSVEAPAYDDLDVNWIMIILQWSRDLLMQAVTRGDVPCPPPSQPPCTCPGTVSSSCSATKVYSPSPSSPSGSHSSTSSSAATAYSPHFAQVKIEPNSPVLWKRARSNSSESITQNPPKRIKQEADEDSLLFSLRSPARTRAFSAATDSATTATISALQPSSIVMIASATKPPLTIMTACATAAPHATTSASTITKVLTSANGFTANTVSSTAATTFAVMIASVAVTIKCPLDTELEAFLCSLPLPLAHHASLFAMLGITTLSTVESLACLPKHLLTDAFHELQILGFELTEALVLGDALESMRCTAELAMSKRGRPTTISAFLWQLQPSMARHTQAFLGLGIRAAHLPILAKGHADAYAEFERALQPKGLTWAELYIIKGGMQRLP